MERGFVIDGNLLAWVNIAECHEDYVSVEDLHVTVGFAGMVDVVRAISTPAAIQAPTIIDGTDPKSSSPGSAIGFGVGYFLSSVLSYFQAASE